MSKMGDELDRRLDEAKYDMYEALKELTEALQDEMGLAAGQIDGYIKAKRVIARVER